jgi:hypothetical protein
MNYVIEVDENGNVTNHPICVENLLSAYPDLDAKNLPEKYKPFKQSDRPHIGIYEKYGEPFYVFKNGEYTTDWNVLSLTVEEKNQKQELFKTFQHPDSWIWSEEMCHWIAPVPHPDDEKIYHWC